jgi:hypothetical protein
VDERTIQNTACSFQVMRMRKSSRLFARRSCGIVPPGTRTSGDSLPPRPVALILLNRAAAFGQIVLDRYIVGTGRRPRGSCPQPNRGTEQWYGLRCGRLALPPGARRCVKVRTMFAIEHGPRRNGVT